MSAHTRGPWVVRAQGAMSGSEDRIFGPNDRIVGVMSRHGGGRVKRKMGAITREVFTRIPTDEDIANARLIAAAPDLLEALQATLKHVDDDMNSRPVTLWKLREIVCAAIAKAEGKS